MTPAEESSSDATALALDDIEAPVPVADGAANPRRVGASIHRLITISRARRRSLVVIVLTVAALGFAAWSYFALYRPDRLVDDAATDQAVRAASDGAVAVLSYSSDTLDHDFAAAKAHLTGDFLAYYNKFTTGVVAPVVRDKHLVQQAVVVKAAASRVTPTSAVVLAFVNETVTSADKPEPLTTPTAVRVTLERVHGTWLIAKLDPIG